MLLSGPKILDSMELMLSVRYVLSEKKAFTYKKLLMSIPVSHWTYLFHYVSVYWFLNNHRRYKVHDDEEMMAPVMPITKCSPLAAAGGVTAALSRPPCFCLPWIILVVLSCTSKAMGKILALLKSAGPWSLTLNRARVSLCVALLLAFCFFPLYLIFSPDMDTSIFLLLFLSCGWAPLFMPRGASSC